MVKIRISYFGGYWRYHIVSADFKQRLTDYLWKRRNTTDIVMEIIDD